MYHGNALDLLGEIPTASVYSVITDAMYGTAKNCRYDWGADPGKGNPDKHWQYHEPLYRECLRVLKPGGILAWGQGFKFIPHFNKWFGSHRIWSPLWWNKSLNFVPNVWVVQTKEGRPVEHPNNMVFPVNRNGFVKLKELHPCPKPLEEMVWLIQHLTQPDDIILDCFVGTGTTLVAAEQLGRRWIGCDRSRLYCQIAMARLEALRSASA